MDKKGFDIFMKEFKYVVQEKVGIHARPAGALARKIKELGCQVTITKADRMADAAKLISVMQLGIRHGDEILVSVDSKDENVFQNIKVFFEENL